jgi:hypothetical protein
MTTSDPAGSGQAPLTQDLLSAARYYLGSRTGIVALAAVAIGAGAWFNWGWLVAAGIAPLIVGVLPCAAMCALGLCMSGRTKNSADVSPHVRDGLPEKPVDGTAPLQPGAVSNAKEKGDCCGS